MIKSIIFFISSVVTLLTGSYGMAEEVVDLDNSHKLYVTATTSGTSDG